MIPMSLRTIEGETAYQKAKRIGDVLPLQREPNIEEWEYWQLKDNRFPYGVAYGKHHLLLPKRHIADRLKLTRYEIQEFEEILQCFVYQNYDLWFENSPKKRSVPGWYHVHLASYHDSREKMQL